MLRTQHEQSSLKNNLPDFQMLKRVLFGLTSIIVLPVSAEVVMNVLRVPHIDDAAPFMILNQQQQPTSGMLFELYERLSRNLGMSLQIQAVPRKLVAQMLLKGDIDVYCNATPDWFPQTELRWSPPLFVHRDLVVSRQHYRDVANFLKYAQGRIGTTNEYIYPTLSGLFQTKQLQRVDSFSPRENLRLLQRNHLDTVVVSELEFKYFMPKTDELSTLVIAQNDIQCMYSPLLTSVQVQQFDAELTRMKKQGELIEIVDKYQ